MKLSLQARKQQKVKRAMLVCSCSLVWGFFLTYSEHGRNPEVQDWSASLNDSCLQGTLNLLSHVFLGGTHFLPEEGCKVRQINIRSWKLRVSRLLSLSHYFYKKNSQRKSVIEEAKCFHNGKLF